MIGNIKGFFLIIAFDLIFVTAIVAYAKEGKKFKQLAIVPVLFVLSLLSATLGQAEIVILCGVSQLPFQPLESDSA